MIRLTLRSLHKTDLHLDFAEFVPRVIHKEESDLERKSAYIDCFELAQACAPSETGKDSNSLLSLLEEAGLSSADLERKQGCALI